MDRRQQPIGSNTLCSSPSPGSYPISEVPTLQVYLTFSIYMRRQVLSKAQGQARSPCSKLGHTGFSNIALAPRSLPAKGRTRAASSLHSTHAAKTEDLCRKQARFAPGGNTGHSQTKVVLGLCPTDPAGSHCQKLGTCPPKPLLQHPVFIDSPELVRICRTKDGKQTKREDRGA